MTTMLTPIDVRSSASAVVVALSDLQGYLSASINPDRIALADLEMEPEGWTNRAYSQKAFEIWRKQLELFRDDPLTVHHMAIMHHARAFDLEAGPRSVDSDADWAAAMSYWHKLHQMDTFWEQLTNKACSGTNRQDVVKKLREDFPQLILAIHYDIALDKETRERRKARAKFHISMAQKAPFDLHSRAEAQRRAYNQYIKSVPDEVWQPNELREDVLEKGQKAIVEYLNYDPGCLPALEDALRLQRRVQRSRNTTWQALSQGDPQRKALLLLEKKDAEAWRPFFDQLVAAADDLEEDVREDLARWYHGRAGDLSALDLEENAIEFYERAVGLCLPDSDQRREYQRDLVRTLAYVARDKVGKQAWDATAYCAKVQKRKDLTALACHLLAHAYLHLSLFDDAAALCDRGLNIEPDFDDLEADEWAQGLTELKQEISVLRLEHKASEAMKASKYADALPSLNEAEKMATAAGIVRKHNSIYWLRAQAHLALDRIVEAKRDVKLYKGLLDRQSPASDVEAGRNLEEMVAAREEMGNIKPLLEKAKQAMEAGRFKDALSPLNEAARKAPKNDVIYFFRCQAYVALENFTEARRDARTVAELAESEDDRQAVRRLNEMIAEAEAAAAIHGLLERARLAMEKGLFSDAMPLLNDAAKKSAKNDAIYFLRCQAYVALGNFTEARRDAKTVTDLATSKEDRQTAQRLNDMIAQAEKALMEFGGPEANKLRGQGISAFNNDRPQEAIKLLRQAIDASRKSGHRDGAPKLKAELSKVLTMAAITMANNAQQGIGRNISHNSLMQLRSAMNETKTMLEEAERLDRTNSQASENLAQVLKIITQIP